MNNSENNKDNNDLEKTMFTAMNETGEKIECEVLLTFDDVMTGESYIVYTDNTVDEEGNVRVYASKYNPEGEDTELSPIETDQEWQLVEDILTSIQEEQNSR